MPRNDEVLNVGVNLEIQQALRSLSQFERQMSRAMKSVSKAIGSVGQANTKVTKQAAKETSAWGKELARLTKGMDMSSKAAAKTGGVDSKALAKEAKEGFKAAIKDFKSVWGSFVSKDIKGALAGVFKGAGGMLGAGAKGGAAKLGGKGGMAGGMGKGLGGIVKVFSKLGPILSMVGSSVMAIVQLFIDVEAKAKDFNKSILATASTAEFLGKNAGNATMAFEDMKDTVNQIRDAAFDLENLEWGISAEEHKAVTNELNNQGVTIVRIAEEAKNAGKSVKEFAAGMTQVSVAYSRAFGVPLQNINEMQGQMMTEMGMSLDETRQAFGQMTRAATESGIASNRFFSEIRGVSQDLSLYNNRLEDSVKLLGMLGKVMSPRNAAKFMQSSMNALKGMGRQQKIQVALLTNPGKIIAKDQERRVKNLAKMLKMETKDVKKALAERGTAGLEDAIGRLEKSRQGAAREFALETEMTGKSAGKGLVGQAMAMGNLGAGAQAQILAKAAMSLGGGNKSIADAIGNLGVEMTADMLGISHEQLKDSAKLEYAVNQQKEQLSKDLQAGGTARLKALNALEKANISEADIASASWDEIIATFSEAQKDKLDEEGLDPMEKLMKRQGELTQSFMDKFQVLLDFIMNQLYSVISGIYDAITSMIPDFLKSDKAKFRDLEKSIYNMSEGTSRDILIDELKKTEGMSAGARMKKIGGMATDLIAEDTAQLQQQINMKAFGLDKLFAQKEGKPVTKEEAILAQLEAIKNSDIQATGKEYGVSEMDQEMTQQIKNELLNMVEGGATDKQLIEQFGPVMNQVMEPWAKALEKAEKAGVTPGGNVTYQKSTFAPENIQEIGTGGISFGDAGTFQMSNKYSDLNKEQQEDLWRMEAQSMGPERASGRRRKREKTDKIMIDSFGSLVSLGGDQNKQLEGLENLLATPNTAYFKFPDSFLKGPYKKVVEDAVLKSVRTALLEYFMLQDLKPDEVAKYIGKTRGGAAGFMELIGKGVAEGKTVKQSTGLSTGGGDDGDKPDGGAIIEGAGKMVMGGRGGVGRMRTIGPDVLIGAKKGEILTTPGKVAGATGGGAASVHITLSPDAARLIRAEAQNQIAAHEAAKRTR